MWPKLILAILFVVFYLATKDLAFKYFGFEPTLPMKVILGVNPTTIRAFCTLFSFNYKMITILV
jgi:hypothetical protein